MPFLFVFMCKNVKFVLVTIPLSFRVFAMCCNIVLITLIMDTIPHTYQMKTTVETQLVSICTWIC